MNIVAFLGAQTLGDFVMLNLVAGAAARAVPGSRLAVLYRDDRPYKAFTVGLNPWVDRAVAVPADPAHGLPLDWFDGSPDPADRPFDDAWYAMGFHAPDVLLTPSQMEILRCPPPIPRFRVPDAAEGPLRAALAGLGLDPRRWFACLHMREDTDHGRGRTDGFRNVDPATYLPAIRHILARGGQVARLGHAANSPLPDLPGLVDLSRLDDSFPLQAYALARARFMLASESGPVQLASALGTPVAATNVVGHGGLNDGDVLLRKTALDADGRPIDKDRLREVVDILATILPTGCRFVDNSPHGILRAAERMIDKTTDCPAWRPPSAPPERGATPTGGHLPLPLPFRRYEDLARVEFLDQ